MKQWKSERERREKEEENYATILNLIFCRKSIFKLKLWSIPQYNPFALVLSTPDIWNHLGGKTPTTHPISLPCIINVEQKKNCIFRLFHWNYHRNNGTCYEIMNLLQALYWKSFELGEIIRFWHKYTMEDWHIQIGRTKQNQMMDTITLFVHIFVFGGPPQ